MNPNFIVVTFDPNTHRVIVKVATPCDEIELLLNKVDGRKHQFGTKQDIIPIKSWNQFVSLATFNEYTLQYLPDVEESIHMYLTRADYLVTLNSRLGKVVIQARDTASPLLYQSGIATWRLHRNADEVVHYDVSISEAYKIPLILPTYNKTVTFDFHEDVKQILETEAARRSKLLEISNAEDAPEITDDISLSLRPFQKVAKAFSKHVNNRAIISYDMGLGKTPIAISIAESMPANTRVLVVCPSTLKTNWKREIKKCCGHEAAILSGASPSELSITSLMNKDIKYHIINYDILGRGDRDAEQKIFISYWAEILNQIGFSLIIYDEAHYMKNVDSGRSKAGRRLKAQHVLHLTGTPVVNRPSELWPLLNIISPETFPSKDSFEGQWFWNNGKSIKDERAFREMLSSYMIRRKKEDVIKDLPSITRIDHFVEMPKPAWDAYNLALMNIYTSLKNPDYQREINSILAQLMRCKQIVADACASESASLAQDIYDETEKKVIIFSQFVDSCKEIASQLGDTALCITGENSDADRYEKIDKFQNDPAYRYMVLSTKAGAEGITLTAAHYVIFNDLCWTPKDHRQAEARCYGRMNDMHGATAYYIQVEKTITEMIMGILRDKLAIIEASVDGLHSNNAESASILNEFLLKFKGM